MLGPCKHPNKKEHMKIQKKNTFLLHIFFFWLDTHIYIPFTSFIFPRNINVLKRKLKKSIKKEQSERNSNHAIKNAFLHSTSVFHSYKDNRWYIKLSDDSSFLFFHLVFFSLFFSAFTSPPEKHLSQKGSPFSTYSMQS